MPYFNFVKEKSLYIVNVQSNLRLVFYILKHFQSILSFMCSFLYSYLKLSAGLAVAALTDW